MKSPTTPENFTKRERRKPVTQQEVFDEETRIVRLLLKRLAALPNEKSRQRVLNRVWELREFPLVDQQPNGEA